jgi:hypothetical protein
MDAWREVENQWGLDCQTIGSPCASSRDFSIVTINQLVNVNWSNELIETNIHFVLIETFDQLIV